jgi:hypothetical protein
MSTEMRGTDKPLDATRYASVDLDFLVTNIPTNQRRHI